MNHQQRPWYHNSPKTKFKKEIFRSIEKWRMNENVEGCKA